MIKLDNQGRLTLVQGIREIAEFDISDKLYCIYASGNILFKKTPDWGIDKVVGIIRMDPRGRIFLNSLREVFDIDMETSFLIWAEPGAIHIEKVEN